MNGRRPTNEREKKSFVAADPQRVHESSTSFAQVLRLGLPFAILTDADWTTRLGVSLDELAR